MTNAPQIEEDMALGNIALDLLGQARALYPYIGSIDGTGRGEDDFAMLRDERDWRNVHLVEQERGDFADEMARLLWFSAYQVELQTALTGSSDDVVAGVAGKALKEVRYHLDHASLWVVRLGDGTPESHRRMQAALERVLPHLAELFDDDEASLTAAGLGVGVLPSSLHDAVVARVVARRRRGDAHAARRLAVALARRSGRHPLAAHGLPPRRDAAHRAVAPRRHVVMAVAVDSALAQAISRIPDPEVPVITIADLGILRDVEVDEQAHTVVVTITPTYSGCPAMEAIASRIAFEAHQQGYAADVRTQLSPAWTTDWMTDEGRAALPALRHRPARAGRDGESRGPVAVSLSRHVVACPRCGSTDTTEIAHFGSTACKALRRCTACLEPFDEFKAI